MKIPDDGWMVDGEFREYRKGITDQQLGSTTIRFEHDPTTIRRQLGNKPARRHLVDGRAVTDYRFNFYSKRSPTNSTRSDDILIRRQHYYYSHLF